MNDKQGQSEKETQREMVESDDERPETAGSQ